MKFILMFVSCYSVHVAAETCCVDPDIAAAFLRHATYSRDWPASFPVEIRVDGLEYIGSSLGNQGRHTSIAWKSAADPDATQEMIVESLIEAGWIPVPENQQMRSHLQRGFVGHQARLFNSNKQYCRDRDGALSIQVNNASVGVVAVLSHRPSSAGRDCAGLIAAHRIQPQYSTGLTNYLPLLALPEGVNMSPYGGSGSGGGSDEAHSSLAVKTGISGAEIMSYFDTQMTAQEWVLDTGFEGNTASGHVWLREVDGLSLICVVTAFDKGDQLRLRMHIEPL